MTRLGFESTKLFWDQCCLIFQNSCTILADPIIRILSQSIELVIHIY